MDIYKYKGWKFGVTRSHGWKVQIRKPSQDAKDLVIDDFTYPTDEQGKQQVVNETREVIDHLIDIARQLR